MRLAARGDLAAEAGGGPSIGERLVLVAGFGVRGPAGRRRARRCPPHRRARRVVRAIGRRAMARGRGLTAPSGLLVVRRPRVVLALDRGSVRRSRHRESAALAHPRRARRRRLAGPRGFAVPARAHRASTRQRWRRSRDRHTPACACDATHSTAVYGVVPARAERTARQRWRKFDWSGEPRERSAAKWRAEISSRGGLFDEL